MQSIFTKKLVQWYQENKRDLPWRGESDPYKVWISEIILQQTRIAQGWQYYVRFVDKFPDIASLADASEDEVLKYWQGLGYYSRARNLHVGAKYILEKHQGIFPDKYNEILRIKGVGEYTAAAIASFCFNSVYPAIDGNALRVFSRVFGIETPIDTSKGRKEIQFIADEMIDKKNPGTFNQAIMDFGAMQCIPANPQCDSCCMRNICIAYQQIKQHILPIKSQKVTIKQRFFYYFFLKNVDSTYFFKRTKKDIWQGLYEFPLIESSAQLSEDEILSHPDFINMVKHCQWEIEKITDPTRHQLTHQLIIYRFVVIRIFKGNPTLANDKKIVDFAQITYYPVSKILNDFLDTNV